MEGIFDSKYHNIIKHIFKTKNEETININIVYSAKYLYSSLT